MDMNDLFIFFLSDFLLKARLQFRAIEGVSFLSFFFFYKGALLGTYIIKQKYMVMIITAFKWHDIYDYIKFDNVFEAKNWFAFAEDWLFFSSFNRSEKELAFDLN